MRFHRKPDQHRRSASKRASIFAFALLATFAETALAAMFAAPSPPPPPPDFDATPEVVAVPASGRTLIVQLPDRGMITKITGNGVIPLSQPGSGGRRGMLCSQVARSPTERAECEAYARLDLQKRSSIELTKEQYGSSFRSSRFFFERRDDQSGIVNAYAGGSSLRILVRTQDELLIRARLLAVTREGDSVIAIESLSERDGVLRWNDNIKRYDSKGLPVPGAEMNVNDPLLVYGDYLVANELGEMALLRRNGDAIAVEWQQLGPPVKRPSVSRSLKADGVTATAAAVAMPVSPPAKTEALTFNYAEFAKISTRLDGLGSGPRNEAISHSKVVANVRAYVEETWVLTKDNYGVEGSSVCRLEELRYWLRPSKFENRIGGTFKGVPYKWGGYVSLEQFNPRIKAEALAGNSCACSAPELDFCVLKNAVGIDATGFLSRVWAVDRQTTASIDGITNPIARAQLRPGDALLKRGEHVRVFLEYMRGKTDIGFRIAESSVICGGVCQRVLVARDLDGYEGRRYKKISE